MILLLLLELLLLMMIFLLLLLELLLLMMIFLSTLIMLLLMILLLLKLLFLELLLLELSRLFDFFFQFDSFLSDFFIPESFFFFELPANQGFIINSNGKIGLFSCGQSQFVVVVIRHLRIFRFRFQFGMIRNSSFVDDSDTSMNWWRSCLSFG